MKKIHLLVSLAAAVIFGACQDFLDTYPKDGVGSAEMWTTEEHADKGIVGIYNSFREKSMWNMPMWDIYGPYAWCRYGTGGTFDEWGQDRIVINTATAQSTAFSERWKFLYRGVTRCNDAITNIPGIRMDEEKRERLLAVAKFGRAAFYFELLDVFSGHHPDDPGVPLYTEMVYYQDLYFPRTKPAAVRYQMIKDLEEAIPHLPFATHDGTVNQAAARMLLGKVYLYAGDFAKAADIFGQLIEDNEAMGADGFRLYDNYGDLFQPEGKANREFIMRISNTDLQAYGTFMFMVYGHRTGYVQGSNVSIPTTYLVDSYRVKKSATEAVAFDWADHGIDIRLTGSELKTQQDAFWNDRARVDAAFAGRDPRLEMTVQRPWATYLGYTDAGGTRLYTYYPKTSYSSRPADGMYVDKDQDVYIWRKFVPTIDHVPIRRNSPTDIPAMRLADLYLLYAEARNEISGPVESVYTAINMVRQRPSVDMPPLTGLTQAQMREAIRWERAWELAGEGFSYSDFRRWYKHDPSSNILDLLDGQSITGFNLSLPVSTRVFKERNWQWAIPKSEVDMNKFLTQYPGWEQ